MSTMERMPQFDLFPRLHKAGRFIAHMLGGPHMLATHGDHLFEHPLDPPIEPVTDWPEQGVDDGTPAP